MMRSFWLPTVLILTFAGCSSSSKPDTGGTCLYNSDCQAGLTCSFGRCLAACQAEADCPSGQQCVKNASGINVCLLPEIESCVYTSQCQPPLVCALDFKCRNQCQSDRDCATKTQKCVLPDGVCAEPSAIDPTTGGLKPASVRLDGGVLDAAPIDGPVSPDVAITTPDTQPIDVAVADVPMSPDVTQGTIDVGVCNLDAASLTLPSSITADLALPSLPGCAYRATSSVTVRSGATLTLGAGATVEFSSGAGLVVQGALTAAGSAIAPIVFRGTQATAGFWKGILFDNSDNIANVLDYVVVENAGTMSAGSSAVMLGSVVVSYSRVQIRNTTIRGGSGVGLALRNPTLDDFAGNVITQNALGAINVDASVIGQLLDSPPSSLKGNTLDAVVVDGDTVSVAQTWPALDVPYLVGGTLNITANVTVQAGAKFRMSKDAYVHVSGANSGLTAKGAAGSEIVFSGDQATRGFWKGVHFDNSDDVDNLLEYVTIEHAGTASTGSSAYRPASLVVQSSRVQIKSTIVRQGSGVGVTLRSPTLDAFAGNSITENAQGAINVEATEVGKLVGAPLSVLSGNDVDYVIVNTGTVGTAQTWPTFDVPYYIGGDLTVGATLVLSAGSSLVFKQDAYVNVNSSGALTAKGLAGAGKQITFVGEQATPGYWGGLWFSSSKSTENVLDYVAISHGGGRSTGSSTRFPANVYAYGSTLTVTNSAINSSASYGIWWDSTSTVTQTGNTFSGNVTDTP